LKIFKNPPWIALKEIERGSKGDRATEEPTGKTSRSRKGEGIGQSSEGRETRSMYSERRHVAGCK